MAGNDPPDKGTPLERERRLVEAARQQAELKASEEEGPTTPPPDSADDTAEPSSVGEDIAFAHVGASLLEALVAPPANDAAEKLAAEISRYEVLGPLGKGGMGEVYKARDRRLGRTVALKRIGRRIEGSKGALPRLLAEARAVAALNHHNIVQVYDIDQDDDGHFITMEYVEGEDLRAKIQRDGKIDPERAIEIIRQLAAALGYAHAHNIIHRDIKPSNVLIDTQGTPKLADFGLARMAGTATPGLTQTGAMMGTVDYASPEQLENAKNVDHRTDIYSLGATLYEMVTGLSPRRIEESKVVEELRPCVMKSLERDLDRRYQTVDELAESLAQVIIGDVDALLHKAEFCHRSGDLEGAAQRYERVLRIDQEHIKARKQLALIESKIEDTRQARREATDAARRGDWQAASAGWQRVLDSAPGDLEAIQQHSKAQSQIRNEQLIAAIERARSHLDDGNPLAARGQCRIAHQIDPGNQEVSAILNGVRAAERRLRDHKMRAGAEAFKLKGYSSAVVLLTEALSLMRKNHPNRPKLINSINLARASQWIADADDAIDKGDLVQAADLLDRANERAGKMRLVVKRIETRRKRITERQVKAAKQATRRRRFRIAMIASASAVGVALIAVLGTWLLRSQGPETPGVQTPTQPTEATATSGEDSLVELLSDFESENPLVPYRFTNARWRAIAEDETAKSKCEIDRGTGAEGTGASLKWSYEIKGKYAGLELLLSGSWNHSVDLSAYDAISFYIKGAGHKGCAFGVQSAASVAVGDGGADIPVDVSPKWRRVTVHLNAEPFRSNVDFSRLYMITLGDNDDGSVSNTIWIDQVMLHRRGTLGLQTLSAAPEQGVAPLVITADEIPMEVGDKWTFAISSPDPNLDGGRDFYSFYDKFEHDGETYFRRRAEIPGVMERTSGLQVLRDDGWFGFWDPDDEIPYDVTVELPLSAGMEWEHDVLFKNNDGTTRLRWNKWRAEAEETIHVPAGDFRCIRIRRFEYTPEEDDDWLVWLAPNVGMVKFVVAGQHTFELLSFERSASSQGAGASPIDDVAESPVHTNLKRTEAEKTATPTRKAVTSILYVSADAEGRDDGTSWGNAYRNLQRALANAEPGQEIWVVQGTFTPAPRGGDRTASFQLKSGVGLFGGFAGSETERGQRDPAANVTVLSGDLNGDDLTGDLNSGYDPEFTHNAENSYHVVTGSGTDASAILDGFTIRGGNANGAGPVGLEDTAGEYQYNDGGGLYNREGGSPTVHNCVFTGNFAADAGGAVYNRGKSSPRMVDCVFSRNRAKYGGGLMNRFGSEVTLLRCLFRENSADEWGGGMRSVGCNTGLVGCVFQANTAGWGGGLAMSMNSKTTLITCAFYGNTTTGPDRDAGAIGINNNCELTLTNCVFSGNRSGRFAAALHISEGSRATAINCTFSYNSAGSGGGVVECHKSSYAELTNCLLWGNRNRRGADQAAQIVKNDSTMVINNCTVQGWTGRWSGARNNGYDPLLRDPDGLDDTVGTMDDDVRLRLDSPCVDAGDAAVLPKDVADLDGDGLTDEAIPYDFHGRPRKVGRDPDIGACELPIIPRWCGTPEEGAHQRALRNGRMVGLGVSIVMRADGAWIQTVFPGSGGDQAGLKPGSTIIEIDGRSAAGMSASDAVESIMGPTDSTVELVVRLEHEETRTVTATRRMFVIPSVESELASDRVGLMRIRNFTEETKAQVRRALRDFSRRHVEGLVVDLRNGGGGVLSEIVKVIDLFVGADETLFHTQEWGKEATPVRSKQEQVTDLPVIVLVNAWTGGELMASALRCTGRATLVGQRTAGVTSLKHIVKNADGSTCKVVYAQCLTCDGSPITLEGIEPDFPIPLGVPPEEFVDRAIALLESKTETGRPR